MSIETVDNLTYPEDRDKIYEEITYRIDYLREMAHEILLGEFGAMHPDDTFRFISPMILNRPTIIDEKNIVINMRPWSCKDSFDLESMTKHIKESDKNHLASVHVLFGAQCFVEKLKKDKQSSMFHIYTKDLMEAKSYWKNLLSIKTLADCSREELNALENLIITHIRKTINE